MNVAAMADIVSWVIFGHLVVGFIPQTPPPIPNQPPTVLAAKATPTPTSIPTPTPSPTSTPTPIPKPTATPIPTIEPTPITATTDLESLFTRFSSEYSVDKELLKRIAHCESGFNTNASGANGQYLGMFQFSQGAWITARTRMGYNNDASLRTNPEESIRTAAFLIAEHHSNLWPNCSK